jgi:hypothetical protein
MSYKKEEQAKVLQSYYMKNQKTQTLKTLEGNISIRELLDVRKPASLAPTLP